MSTWVIEYIYGNKEHVFTKHSNSDFETYDNFQIRIYETPNRSFCRLQLIFSLTQLKLIFLKSRVMQN